VLGKEGDPHNPSGFEPPEKIIIQQRFATLKLISISDITRYKNTKIFAIYLHST